MRGKVAQFAFAALALSATSSALAADILKFGPPPSWVAPTKAPNSPKQPSEAPFAVLLNDQQVHLEPGKSTVFNETMIKIQSAQGLSAGNVSIPWNPATDTVTVHRLHILRGGQVIDVLANQQFTTIRRESNLEAAMLDGRLTATIQPEGLQEGDIVEFAATLEHADPVMKGHVETVFGMWNGIPIELGRARLIWPTDMKLKLRQSGELPKAKTTVQNGLTIAELSAENVQPLLPPASAPPRFLLGRIAEASNFDSWSAIADLMVPLYRTAAVVPPSGPLREEVERIRRESTDAKSRTEKALALVQDRVRYVALLMGDGGYVPATAETTWSRRFGDCKGKTALLLAILHELGIEADAVAVHSALGDAIPERLPMLSQFNHVLVRAQIGGKTYWLDGTRTGDTALDRLQVPNFRWGLPLVAKAELVPMLPAPLTTPISEQLIEIDARGGVYAPAAVSIEQVFRGEGAVMLNSLYTQVTGAQRDQSLRENAKKHFNTITVKSSAVQFDKAKGELRLTIKGDAKLEWDDGWFFVPASSVGYNPDFDRAAGPLQEAPFAIAHPDYEKRRVTLQLPPGFAAKQDRIPAAVKETLAGVEYTRTVAVSGDTITVDVSERSIAAEVPYKDALAAAGRLKTISNDDFHLQMLRTYDPTKQDAAALSASKPATAEDFFTRAHAQFVNGEIEAGIADLNSGLALDPKNIWALVKRAEAHSRKQRFTEAEKDLRAAEAILPNNTFVLGGWGDLAERRGDMAAALQFYDRSVRQDSSNSFARLKRALLTLQQGKRDEALSDAEAVIAAEPRNVRALAIRAQIRASKEQWSAAEGDVAAALALDPTDSTALTSKALIALQKRDYDTAFDAVSRALTKEPNNPFALGVRSQLLKRKGNSSDATRLLDEAVAGAPGSVWPLLSRASARLEAKEFEAAERDIVAALAIEPANPAALYARSELATARGDYKGAVEALTAALDKYPSNGPMLASRAEAYRTLGQFDLALADTEAALKTGHFAPSLRLLRINILLQKGEPDRVAAETDLLVKENPTSEFSLVAAGKTYKALGLREKAMEAFDRALAIGPYPYIYVNRAQARSHDDVTGKLADLDSSLKLEPNNPDALTDRARLLSRQGKHPEAIETYDRAIASALDSSYLDLGRAILLQHAGRSAEAAKIFEAERSKAKSASDFNRLCFEKAKEGVLLESALEDCREALRRDPDYRRARENLGLVLLKLGRLEQARSAYDEAVAKETGTHAYMGRAIVHARMGDLERARIDGREARRRRPGVDDEFAEYGLQLELPAGGGRLNAEVKPAAAPQR